MENTITFKPKLWRWLLSRTIPLLIFLIVVKPTSIDFLSFLGILTVLILLQTVLVFLIRKQFDIVISAENITGVSTEILLRRETFAISHLDISSLYKQSFVEKVFGLHTLRSVYGDKIIIESFVFGKSTFEEIFKTIQQQYLQSSDKKKQNPLL